MAIYPLGAGTAAFSELLPDVVSNRTIVTGDPHLRSLFVANVVSAVSQPKAGEFLLRKTTQQGKVLMFLPALGASGEYATLVAQAGGIRDMISWTYDMQSFLEEDLSKYSLVVIDELVKTVSSAKAVDPMTADVRLPNQLLTAPNLLVASTRNEPNRGSYSASTMGEVNILEAMLTKVVVNNDAIEITSNGNYLKLGTNGEAWQAPKVVVQEQGDWVKQYDHY